MVAAGQELDEEMMSKLSNMKVCIVQDDDDDDDDHAILLHKNNHRWRH